MDTIEPKRRGRPPKPKPDNIDIIKRKRGRPPKPKIDNIDIVKKKVGRPQSELSITERTKQYYINFKGKGCTYHCDTCNKDLNYYSKNRHIRLMHPDQVN